MRLSRAFAAGLLLTTLHIALVCIAQGQMPSPSAWENMYHWDSEHYGDIAAEGYFSKLPPPVGDTEYSPGKIQRLTNVAFFPGYPIAARGFLLLGLPKHFALLLVAAIANVFFWMWMIILCAQLQMRRRTIAVVVFFLLCQPTAFYLVTAYSESLFLAALMGMMVLMERRPVLAGLHGYVMTLTRIFGLPLAILPFFALLFERLRTGCFPKRWMTMGIPALLTMLGPISFFLYCHVAFGWWNLYMVRQAAGWDLRASWLLLPGNDFWSMFWPDLHVMADDLWLPTLVNRLTTSIVFWVLAVSTVLIVREWKKRPKTIALQSSLFATAVVLFYMPVATLINAGWRSMSRYAFPVTVFVVLAMAPTLLRMAKSPRQRVVLGGIVMGLGLGLAALEWVFIYRFSIARWVA